MDGSSHQHSPVLSPERGGEEEDEEFESSRFFSPFYMVLSQNVRRREGKMCFLNLGISCCEATVVQIPKYLV